MPEAADAEPERHEHVEPEHDGPVPADPLPADPVPADRGRQRPDFGRTVLFTGTSGSGRTTVAAATALATARRGARTLLLSGAPSEVLIEVLGTAPGTAPHERSQERAARQPGGTPGRLATEPRLWVLRVEPDEDFRSWANAVQEQCRTALELTGATPLAGDELTPLPGAESFAMLRVMRLARPPAQGTRGDDRQHGLAASEDGPWDVVIVDLPPAEQALSLLALPEQLRRYLRRLLPGEKRAARALRPILAEWAGVPMPDASLYRTTSGWDRELATVQGLFASPRTTVRLVTRPTPVPCAALGKLRAAYALHGLRIESVIANQVLPYGSAEPWLATLTAQQEEVLGHLRNWCRAHPDRGDQRDVAAVGPLTEIPHLGRDPRGPSDLTNLGTSATPQTLVVRHGTPADRTYTTPDDAVSEAGDVPGRVENHLAERGQLHWWLELPGAERQQLGLVRHGDELCVRIGVYRRLLPLPAVLRRCRVVGAALDEGVLRVRFEPEPGLWPERSRRNG